LVYHKSIRGRATHIKNPEKMKGYIKLKSPPNLLPNTIVEQRELTNIIWKEHIFSHILSYFKQIDNLSIQQIIEEESKKSISNIETAIKKNIKAWFRENKVICRQGFTVNIEVGSEGEKEGFYDIKVQHSFWNDTKTYFPFECKNLGKFKSTNESKSINEYVFVAPKNDGGMYRYFIDKYSANQNFGGMIGFVIAEASDIQTKIINKIHQTYENNDIGKLAQEKIIHNSIFGNSNTFDSIHLRKNTLTKKDEIFTIHHIIMDFVTVQ